MTGISRIFDLLDRYQKDFQPKEDVLAGKLSGKWRKYNIEEYIKYSDYVSYALLSLGIKKGDKVASVVKNSPQWNFMDMGIMRIGAIHVPIYPTSSEQDFEYILKHAEVKLIFVSGGESEVKAIKLRDNVMPELMIYCDQPKHACDDFNDFLKIGEKNPVPKQLKEISGLIQSDDVATLIYTSGTTGVPKGVMLSHNNMISNFYGVSNIPTFGEEGKAISFLPLCHVYERMLNYMYQYLGISIYYAESMGTIVDNILDIKPDMMTTVPRFLEKVFDKILHKGRNLKGIKKSIFNFALNVAENYDPLKERGFGLYNVKLSIARTLVLNKWRKALGGNFKIIVSGGAALQPRIARAFWAAKLPVYEGYGLTETSPVIAVTNNDEKGVTFGTVGPALRGVEVKIDDEGEIICKGPNIMKGYYKAPELTKEVIDEDGWFHTGDMGKFNERGHLSITGRKKEIFKTSAGKYIAPQLIENKLKASPFIDNAMVVGENEKFASAIVVPDYTFLKSWCRKNQIPFEKEEYLLQNKQVRYRVLREIHNINLELGKPERIQKFRFCQNVWSPESGELTPTLKLKRNVIQKKYKQLINEIYRK